MMNLVDFRSKFGGRSLIEGTAVVIMPDKDTMCAVAFYVSRRSGKLVARIAEMNDHSKIPSWDEAWNNGVLFHNKVEWEAGVLPPTTTILRKLGIK